MQYNDMLYPIINIYYIQLSIKGCLMIGIYRKELHSYSVIVIRTSFFWGGGGVETEISGIF